MTAPVLLDLLLCHSRAWLPREESRSFPTSSSGIRDSSRAPDTRAGMTEKFDRADVRVTILCRTQIVDGKTGEIIWWGQGFESWEMGIPDFGTEDLSNVVAKAFAQFPR